MSFDYDRTVWPNITEPFEIPCWPAVDLFLQERCAACVQTRAYGAGDLTYRTSDSRFSCVHGWLTLELNPETRATVAEPITGNDGRTNTIG